MKNTDDRIDLYISKSEKFAQPVLKHIRKLIHKSCPDIQETIKWGFPNFTFKGLLCYMASFKQHCSFGFYKMSLMKDKYRVFSKKKEGMGSFGKIKSIKDLPSDKILNDYIKESVRLNEEKSPTRRKNIPLKNKSLTIPGYLIKYLSNDKMALETFKSFSYSHKKEYVEWISEAKTEATRQKRMELALTWLKEGKPRNWKYVKKQKF